MKKTLFVLFFIIGLFGYSQILPVFRYQKPIGDIGLINSTSTFGYSLRKLGLSYSGAAVKIRKATVGEPEGDVAFDATGIVSGSSIVTITKAGDGLLVNQTLTLTAFKTANLYVVTWYNQGNSAFDATQTSSGNQPVLALNSAGTGDTKPSILFTRGTPTLISIIDDLNDLVLNGGDFLTINQPIQNILSSDGIRGTFLWALKTTTNYANYAFGYITPTWRWSFHVNWSTNELYFDAAETCCATFRAFANGANLNLWKQYTIVRGNTYKTVRISGNTTGLNNSTAASKSRSGGNFRIGHATNGTYDTFSGNISELLMFPTDLPLSDIQSLENNQIAYWNL